MAKNGIYSEVEKLATRIANDIVKNHPLIASMAHWHSVFTAENKNIRDANRILELRIVQLEKDLEQLKKIQMSVPENMSSTLLEEPIEPEVPQEPAMTPRELKKIRSKYNFNQQKMAELMGVSSHRYNKWERGEQEIPREAADNLRAFTEMPLGELREFLHSKGIFQPNGTVARQQKVTKAQTIINSVQQSRYLAEDLKRIRTAARYTQKQMAEYIGVPVSTYTSWECNNCRMPDIHTQKINTLQENMSEPSDTDNLSTPKVRIGNYPVPSPYKANDLITVRTRLNFTQRQMALHIGVPTNTYGTWERGICNMPDKYTKAFETLAEAVPAKKKVAPVVTHAETPVAESVPQESPAKIIISIEKLRRTRIQSGMTQRQFAQTIGVSHSQYLKWELKTRGISSHFAEIIAQKYPETIEHTDNSSLAKYPGNDNIYASDLEQLRSRLKMTYKDFSQRLGVTENTYLSWRKKNALIAEEYLPRVKRLYALAKGVPIQTPVSVPETATPSVSETISMSEVEKARIRLNLTLAVISEMIGISVTTYKTWKSNNINVPERVIENVKKVMSMTVPATDVKGNRTRGSKKNTPPPRRVINPSSITAGELKNLRSSLGLTQKKIAEKFGVSTAAYQKWELGDCRMPETYTEKYKHLLSGLSSEINMPEVPVNSPDAPPIPKASLGRLEVTPEMLMVLNSARQEFGLSEEKMSVLMEMDIKTYRQLVSGEKNTIKVSQWEKLEFFLNLPEDRRKISVQQITNTGKENNE